MRSPWRDSPRRRLAWFALIAAVLVAHLMVGVAVVASAIGWDVSDEPRRIDVALVKPLAPTTPPPSADEAPVPAAAPRPAHAVRAARAGSAAAPSASSSRDELLAEALALAASQAAASASAAGPAASAASEATAAASASPPASVAVAGAAASAPVAGPAQLPFDWPPSTRLTYTLTGERNGGHLYGDALVEWRRDGAHYQVQFDIHITPFIEQHMQSDGQIGPDGLSPGRYDETFKVPLMAPRARKVEFGDDDVTLANGNRVPRLPQTQDGASQFVQFVWMFATHPSLLKTGNVVDIPLALAYSLRRWHYVVTGTDALQMPFGTISAIHLKPLLDGPRKPNEYPFEIWTAPALQYMPVRVLVKTDERTFADLTLDALPLQAGEAPPPVRAVAPPPLPRQPGFGER